MNNACVNYIHVVHACTVHVHIYMYMYVHLCMCIVLCKYLYYCSFVSD